MTITKKSKKNNVPDTGKPCNPQVAQNLWDFMVKNSEVMVGFFNLLEANTKLGTLNGPIGTLDDKMWYKRQYDLCRELSKALPNEPVKKVVRKPKTIIPENLKV